MASATSNVGNDASGEPLLPEPWTVLRAARETPDVVTLEIAPSAGSEPRRPRPGQFLMLYVFGIGEVPISVAGLGDRDAVVHTIRDVGAVTHALCQLGPGDTLGVRGPFGTAWPLEHERGRDIVIGAGGIGMAPLRPVVTAIMADRASFDDVVVMYGAREPRELLYTDEFASWRAADIQVEVTVDHADHAWDGHIGVVTTLIRYADFQPNEAAAFLCGPEIMMRFTAQELVQRGVDPRRVHLSMERNMKCAVGFCGHCQLGPEFVCLDGPVFPWPRMERLMAVHEL